jgi:hypothetical protein
MLLEAGSCIVDFTVWGAVILYCIQLKLRMKNEKLRIEKKDLQVPYS